MQMLLQSGMVPKHALSRGVWVNVRAVLCCLAQVSQDDTMSYMKVNGILVTLHGQVNLGEEEAIHPLTQQRWQVIWTQDDSGSLQPLDWHPDTSAPAPQADQQSASHVDGPHEAALGWRGRIRSAVAKVKLRSVR